ncbi:MAG: response regulator [Candidatus Dadabacteria bacterium]
MINTSTNRLVIYVDDDEDDLAWVSEEFEKYPDVELLTFSDSCKFLKHIIEERAAGRVPSLIMLDINMPVLDGKEILTILRSYKEFHTIPIAFYTTSDYSQDKSFAKSFDARFVTKPHSRQLLSKTISDLLEYCSAV